MMGLTLRSGIVLVALTLFWVGTGRAADDSGSIRVLAVSPSEGRAVIRVGSEESAIRSVSDRLQGGRYVVRRVLEDHVVLEERVQGKESVELWVYVADSTGVSRVERLERSPAPPPAVSRSVLIPATPERKKK